MKKKELEKLDEINKEKNLTKEEKESIAKKVLDNFLIAVDILLFFVILMVATRNLDKAVVTLIYKIASVILLIFTFILFEVAYKKDNDVICIHGIEMLVLSIITLLTPYIFIKKTSVFTSLIGAYFTAYYILKNLVIYKKEKSKYLKEKNDIKEIVKKESKDTLNKEKLEKRAKELEKTEKKNTGRPRKNNVEKEKNVGAHDFAQDQEEQKPVKRKPGRPRKNNVEKEKNVGAHDSAQEQKPEKKKPGRPRKNNVESQKKKTTTTV